MGRPGTDYVLIARAMPSEQAYAELVADLEAALRQLDRRKGNGGSPGRPRTAEER